MHCDSAMKTGKMATTHEYPKNWDQSSKAMESAGLVKMAHQLWLLGIVVATIISDEDSTMCKWGMNKKDGGQLDDKIQHQST